MRACFSLVLLVCNAQAHAQFIINGSFEDGSVPSLAAWEWTCEEPQTLNNAPAGAGDWHATKEAGHAKGCFPNYLFQRINGVQDEDVLTISGWVRCDDDVICLGANFGLGIVNNGVFQLEETVGTNQFPWTYLSITDTVELAEGDTSILVLNAGFIGGPIDPEPGHFDGFTVDVAQGITVASAPRIVQYCDGEDLYFAGSGLRILSARTLDMTGRMVNDRIVVGSGTVRIGTSALRKGVYCVELRTDLGTYTVRFVVEQL